jgi:hypothetical protein
MTSDNECLPGIVDKSNDCTASSEIVCSQCHKDYIQAVRTQPSDEMLIK